MKIVHIITRLIVGGAQENTLITCKVLAQRGHDVTLVTGPALGPEGELFDQAKGQGYEIIVVDRLRRVINPINDVPSYFQIKKLLRQLQPDIVHTHSAKAGILGRFAGYALKGQWAANRPWVVHGIHGLAFHPYQNPLLNKFYIVYIFWIWISIKFFSKCHISFKDTMNSFSRDSYDSTSGHFITFCYR